MTAAEFQAFCAFRSAFKAQVDSWAALADKLLPLQTASSQKDTPAYPVETPVVYNTALDDVKQNDTITIILVGDNPGKEEQREKNRRYLVGQSGKLADSFFRKHPELNTDFRRNVIILNKTPVHTAKTNHLKYLMQHGDDSIRKLMTVSQSWMAQQTAALHQALAAGGTQLWLVGYSELKPKGLFTEYRDTLKAAYERSLVNDMRPEWNSVLVFQHFSMNCFSIDLNRFTNNRSLVQNASDSLPQTLLTLGSIHRGGIFGI